MIDFNRAPCPHLIPREAYDVRGDLYAEVFDKNLHGVAFRPLEANITVREWIEKRFGSFPKLISTEGSIPWLEFPFEQDPDRHPHFNHGNTHVKDPEYYFVVMSGPREFGQKGIFRHLLFVPSRTSKSDVQEHLGMVFGAARLHDVPMPPMALPAAA